MHRRSFLQAGLSVAAAGAASLPHTLLADGGSSPAREPGTTQGGAQASGAPIDVAALYAGAIAIDTLANSGPIDNPQDAVAAGLTALVLDLPIYPRTFPAATAAMAAWNAEFAKPQSGFLKVQTAADITRAKREKKLGVILSSQDAQVLDASTVSVNDYNIQNLKKFHQDGMRILQLTHNERNGVGDSFREKGDAGLSRLGEKVVEAMNALHMLIDVSHCSDRTTLEAVALSTQPIAITHAGCRALYPTKRNKTDEAIRAVAKKGGVFGVFNMSVWLTEKPTTSIDDVLDHIDHAVKVAGVEHVSFGSDGPILQDDTPEAKKLAGLRSYTERNLGLPGAERLPNHVMVAALNSPHRLLRLAEGLSRRRYKAADIEKIIGGNFVRLFQEVCG